ncbi:Gfo/Idh/MocA family oxidoreductase [soil metagenome]
MADTLRLAIIGAGTIVEIMHLPAAAKTNNISLAALFDPNLHRAQLLAARYAIPVVDSDYKNHLDKFDAAIVATPNNTHAAISIDLLRAGKHVLVEKPAAFSVSQLEDMMKAEKDGKAKIGVGQVKRFYPYHKFIKQALADGVFGNLRSIDIQYSTIFNYPMASDSFLRKETAGGGCFFDMGVHYLDLLNWWVGPMEIVRYEDDAVDGIEASARIELIGNANKIPITISLDRLRELPSYIHLRFEQSSLEIKSVYGGGIEIQTNAGNVKGDLPNVSNRPYLQNGIDQLEAFVKFIKGEQPAGTSLQEAWEVLTIIERAYAQKQPITYEWEQVGL